MLTMGEHKRMLESLSHPDINIVSTYNRDEHGTYAIIEVTGTVEHLHRVVGDGAEVTVIETGTGRTKARVRPD